MPPVSTLSLSISYKWFNPKNVLCSFHSWILITCAEDKIKPLIWSDRTLHNKWIATNKIILKEYIFEFPTITFQFHWKSKILKTWLSQFLMYFQMYGPIIFYLNTFFYPALYMWVRTHARMNIHTPFFMLINILQKVRN